MLFTYFLHVDYLCKLSSQAFNCHIPRDNRSNSHAYRIAFILKTFLFLLPQVDVTVDRHFFAFQDCTFNLDLVNRPSVGISYHAVIFWMPLASASSSSSLISHPSSSQLRFKILVEMWETQWRLCSEEKIKHMNVLKCHACVHIFSPNCSSGKAGCHHLSGKRRVQLPTFEGCSTFIHLFNYSNKGVHSTFNLSQIKGWVFKPWI